MPLTKNGERLLSYLSPFKFDVLRKIAAKALLFLLVQDTHCSIKDCCVVQSNYATIGTLLDVNTYALLCLEVLTTKIVSYGLYVDTQFVCNTL